MSAREEPPNEPYDLRLPAKAAIALLLLSVVVDLVAIVFDLLERGVVEDILAGRGDLAAASASDARQRIAAVTQLGVLILAAAAFIRWFSRAYRNLLVLGVARADLRHRAGWSIGAWFVPIVNLFWPKQIANDIWRASSPRAEPPAWPMRRVAPLVHWWWGVWLLASFLQNAAARLSRGSLDRQPTADLLDAAGLALELPAAVLVVLVIRAVTERQRAALAAGELNAPDTDAPHSSGVRPPMPLVGADASRPARSSRACRAAMIFYTHAQISSQHFK